MQLNLLHAGVRRERPCVGERWLWIGVAIAAAMLSLYGRAAASYDAVTPIEKGWKLQSSCIAKADGAVISTPAFKPTGWIDAAVPGTVLGSQVMDGIFADPFFGMQMRQIPGTDYPIGKVFGYMPMSESSPYRCSWWYRVEFTAPVFTAVKHAAWLHFDGINYRANLWINGKQIASSDTVAGAFRAWDLDVSQQLVNEKRNVLAVEVFAQTEKDLGIDFLDWNPAPADKNMGLWRGVSLQSTGPVTLRNPMMATHFLDDQLSAAELRVTADVANHSDRAMTVQVAASIEESGQPIRVQKQVALAANETVVVHFVPQEFPQLIVQHPAVWWPWQYGEPRLGSLRMSVAVEEEKAGVAKSEAISDEKSIRFGVREIDAALNASGALQFRVNRRSLLIRGGGWAPDLFYREPRERLRHELEYAKHMRLNTIRLEGKLGSDALFDLADEMGLLVMPGWQCCDAWQHWDKWSDEDKRIADASLTSQIDRLRSHASALVWVNGSDEAAPPKVEKDALAILAARDWPNPILSTAADRTSEVTGRSGVKMTGPYDYVPPEYWTLDHDKYGGAYGFNTETSPGPAIPLASGIRRMLPKASWWPQDGQWSYHAGLGKFAQLTSFNRAMDETYGAAADLEDYTRKAQLMAYDGERAMFEAYSGSKYKATGVVQWMLNNAWPAIIWHLYDYRLVPGGGYFGTRKANEPVHIQYRYNDRSVSVVNSTLRAHDGLRASARWYAVDGKLLGSRETAVDVAADGVSAAFVLPQAASTILLRLMLHDEQGRLLSDNVYWLPATLAELNWEKTTYVNTPAFHYADMRDLSKMPAAHVEAAVEGGQRQNTVLVHLRNTGSSIAFFLSLRAVKPGTDDDIAPILWSDNYVTLWPGESVTLTATAVFTQHVEMKLDGWNLRAQTLQQSLAERSVSHGAQHP